MKVDLRPQYQQRMHKLKAELAGNNQRLRVKKKTISNLFRYEGRQQTEARLVDLSLFNTPLYLDEAEQTLEVQGLATYESIVDFILPQGFLPLITPELKHITVGGAIVGIGIETNSYRYGFVHDGLLEADVLLPDGRVVTAKPTGDYSDLFYGLPNSYGTLGYILRAKLRLMPAKPYMHLVTKRYDDTQSLLAAMQAATDDPKVDYIESLAYSKDELYLTLTSQTDAAPKLTSIYGDTIFYREISKAGELWLTAHDYMFRYDPEWFWAIPETPFYHNWRKHAPQALRKSSFYNRYNKWMEALSTAFPFLRGEDDGLEHLIQDWEVPWKQAQGLLDHALSRLDLNGKPLMSAPVRTPAKATGYPLQSDELYFNLGSYNFVKRKAGQEAYASTKLMDAYTFEHDGIKMLYSTTFLTQPQFDRIYNGRALQRIQHKYDPNGLLPSLYDKVVKAQ